MDTAETGVRETAQRLPRWQELPDIELYMDQVLALTERYLGSNPADGRGLTAAMVNNYVKQGVMPPPEKKRYTRTHLAYLFMICLLKGSLPIAAIRQLLAGEMRRLTPAEVYDRFCRLYESTDLAAAAEAGVPAEGDGLGPVWRAALRARAEQALALGLLGEGQPAPAAAKHAGDETL